MKLKIILTTIAIAAVVLTGGCSESDNDQKMTPSVLSSDPSVDATDVVINKIVTVTFSEPMDASSLNSTTFTINQETTPVEGTISYSGTMVSFKPTVTLAPVTVYTGTVTTGAMSDSGNSLENEYVWEFTTGNITGPTAISIFPANNSEDVERNKIVTVTFSEEMNSSTINTSTFTLTQGDTNVPGEVTYSGKTAAFTPTNILDAGKVYTAMLSTGVENAAGVELAGNISWTFTTSDETDATEPTATVTNPLNDATNVERNIAIEATFSEEMDPFTINNSTFILKLGSNEIDGTVDYSGLKATFNPANALSAETVYTATITSEAKDLAGNALAADMVWTFSTGVGTSNLAAVDLGDAGNYVILAKTAINNNPTSAITGDLGLSPAATSYITGFAVTAATGYATSDQVTGQIFAADMAAPTAINLTTAVENMITAYNDAAGRPTPLFLELGTGNIGGQTLEPGLYKWTSTVTIPTNVTLSGGADAVWIFQISGDLKMSSAVNVILADGAQAKNIFWQVAGEATFGATSHFEGIILSMTGITFQTGASFNGRALAQTAVTLDGNIIVEP
ncbi:ice-binding family protein [Marinilabilia sp.]|uniref:ice-binding family protein n=1 Tax=Marinilabilia sp. TaxID=2021252 RepID=UPI0025C0C234|nr:ice-binding family protein [Marinilabilia sp.]